MKINLEKFLIKSFLVLFLFSNLLTRILNVNFNLLFYLIVLTIIIFSLRYVKIIFMKEYIVCFIFFLIISIFNVQASLKYNLWAIKDSIVPTFMFICSILFIKFHKNYINFLNKLYLIFIGYGVFQEYCFYNDKLAKFLPWDYSIIQNEILKNRVSNMFQTGGLLRFWGCMNAFSEYQVTAIFFLLILYLYKKDLANNKIFILNFTLLIIFLIFSIERSPIMMLLVTLLIWKQEKFKKNIGNIFKIATLIVLFLVLILNCDILVKNNQKVYGAYLRFKNVITFNLNEDAAIKDREDNQWKEDMKIVSNFKTFFGLGPATVSTSAGEYKNYIGPHNNFLAYYIGYGFLGLILFLILLFKMVYYFLKMKNYYKFFGIGVILSFCSMAIFNMPFMGKQGIVFFLIMGVLINNKSNYIENVIKK